MTEVVMPEKRHIGLNGQTIAAGIAEATEELLAVREEVTHLQRQLQERHDRATQLQQFITLGKRLLGEEPAEAVTILAQSLSPRRSSAAEYAKQVLEDVQRPMRAQEMADYLHQRGLMPGKWVREVLRTAMGKHQETFERVAQGLYALKAWRPEQKTLHD